MEINDAPPFLFEAFEFKPRKGDLKKLEIIKAAVDILATKGLDNTTYEAIAQEIGTRRAHIAYHFSDKSDIFFAAVKYILATYQNETALQLKGAESGEEMIKRYVSSTFEWARKNPHQVSVMLLLYYMCTTTERFIELNTEVRDAGKKRIAYLLSKIEGKKINSLKLDSLAATIGDLISAGIIAATTQNNLALEEMRLKTLKLVETLIAAHQS